MIEELVIYIDGASKGNPGPSAAGIIIKRDGKKFKEIAKPIGEATNNVAEYYALIFALQEALILKAKRIKVCTDSELLFKQLTGAYVVKSENLKVLFEQIEQLAQGFNRFEIKHIPREENKEADKLASSVLKKKQAKVVALAF